MSRTAARPEKALFELRTPLRARIYRARFRPFATTRYLDRRALATAKRATIECGTLAVAGRTLTISAEVRAGMIVRLKPSTCEGCGLRPSRSRRMAAQQKEVARLVAEGLASRHVSLPTFPIRLATSGRDRSLATSERDRDPINIILFGGALVIVIIFCGEEACNACISVAQQDGSRCVHCIYGDSYCF